MAGVIMQEKILGFTLGIAGGIGSLIYQQKHLWRSTGVVADVYSGGKLPPAEIYSALDPGYLMDTEVVNVECYVDREYEGFSD